MNGMERLAREVDNVVTLVEIITVVYWLICWAAAWRLGVDKGRGVESFMLGLLLGPLGLLAVYLKPAGGAWCRFCERAIPKAAICCCYCTRPLNAPTAKVATANSVRS